MDTVSQLSSDNEKKNEEKVRQKSLIDSMVVLLNSNDSNDDYIDEIKTNCSQNSVDFFELSPIQFNYINGRQLLDSLLAVDNWSAICLTSKRCIDALRHALNCDHNSNIIDLWLKSDNKVFIIGIKSYEYLKATIGWEAIGSQCGNSDNLAQLMINDFKHQLLEKPVLYPCSQSRTDCLPQSLTNAGIVVNEIIVYQTIANKELAQKVIQLNNRLIDCLENRLLNSALNLILIFFSPSGFQSFKPFLIENIIENQKFINKLVVKYVAIGKTTGAALRQSDLTVWFTSPKPNPKSLAQALNENLEIMNNGSKVSAQTEVGELAQ